MIIQQLFDSSRNIYRPIEKVITYAAAQSDRVKSEISEYVVTDNIEQQFFKLLTDMERAMEAARVLSPNEEKTDTLPYEVGVWVSGFYGSGKSSFTKYLGMAFDSNIIIDGVPFYQHLQNRFKDARTRALLSSMVNKFPAAVVMLDLASEMLTGATQETISNVLYFKVLQWAGFSQNLKVAALERKLLKDGNYEVFCQKIKSAAGVEWKDVQNDPLIVDSLLPEIAHEIYPALFKSTSSFDTDINDIIIFENQRVEEMLNIIREKSGKQFVIFVIDEVGQYVGPRDTLILNLDGLAKNLKNIGKGKAWILSTAQQRLAEDDPRAALNSPYLFKLKDRFPINIDLEAKDIKEITKKRLLGKSAEGECVLGQLFDQHGQRLRHYTKLQDAKYFDADFNRESFIDLYPFLPAHFDILLQLLSALAKSTGGIGLRSAIRVIQEILIEQNDGSPRVADERMGYLVNTATLYDALAKDIARAFPSVHAAVDKVAIRFPGEPEANDVAKTVAILQVLDNLPITEQNIAALLQDGVDNDGALAQVQAVIRKMLDDAQTPLGEQDGQYRFFSEKLNEIEQDMTQMALNSSEIRRLFNENLRDALSPLPSVNLHDSLVVKSGLRFLNAGQPIPLTGERETIQFVVVLADPSDYDNQRMILLEESRQRNSQYTIYFIGRRPDNTDQLCAEIFRCQEINRKFRNDTDQEVREYCSSKEQQATKRSQELQRLLLHGLSGGSFVFRGQVNAVESLDHVVLEACRKQLADAAREVFDRYGEAPLRAGTGLAEDLLRLPSLQAVSAKTDPMGLVVVDGGKPRVRTDHKALQSIRDYLDRFGSTEGRTLTEHFTEAPFGWSPDTLRYLIAMQLLAGEIKLRVGGRDVTANGQMAIDAIKSNTAFKNIGVDLRHERPSMEVVANAAQRLTTLLGNTVFPLEDDISKAVLKDLPGLQSKLAPLGERLAAMRLPGKDQVDMLVQQCNELINNPSEAPQRFGAPESNLYNAMQWALEAHNALRNDLDKTIRALRTHLDAIAEMPQSELLDGLRAAINGQRMQVIEQLDHHSFHKRSAELQTALTAIQARVRDAAADMENRQQDQFRAAEADLRRLPGWNELTQEEQANTLQQLEMYAAHVHHNLEGLQTLIRQEYNFANTLRKLKENVEATGRQRRLDRLEQEKEKAKQQGQSKLRRTVHIPAALQNTQQLDQLIAELQNLRNDLELHRDIEITIQLNP